MGIFRQHIPYKMHAPYRVLLLNAYCVVPTHIVNIPGVSIEYLLFVLSTTVVSMPYDTRMHFSQQTPPPPPPPGNCCLQVLNRPCTESYTPQVARELLSFCAIDSRTSNTIKQAQYLVALRRGSGDCCCSCSTRTIRLLLIKLRVCYV